MTRGHLFGTMLGVILATSASGACPDTECDYSDAQYLASAAKWMNCAKARADSVGAALHKLAAEYPRFGSAYNAYMTELRQASQSGSNTAAMMAVKRRFEDSIMQSAEPEAVQTYNTLMLSFKQHPAEEQCGPVPSPPTKTPQSP